MPTFASGLSNPAALVFDSAGNLYVGQVRSPYIAEFSPTGQRMADIGPLKTELFGDDWIDLSSDQCTFYYTSERSDIMRYNKCTKTQLPDFNVAPLPGAAAFELRILPNGNVLVARFERCGGARSQRERHPDVPVFGLPGMLKPSAQLFALAIDPSGTSFWTGDTNSGNIWQVDIATGNVIQTFYNVSAYLYGLSVLGEQTAATAQTTVPMITPVLTIQPVTSGSFSTPTPVSAVLTDTATNPPTPIPGEPITFTLGGTDTCTATTDSNGIATCDITPGEPSGSYPLTASFPGDESQPTPIATVNSAPTSFTVSPDTTTLTYTGPANAVNGQPATLSGTVTTELAHAGAVQLRGGLHHRRWRHQPADLQRRDRRQRECELHHRLRRPARHPQLRDVDLHGATPTTARPRPWQA